MAQNYLLLFHAKAFFHSDNMMKHYSVQYLFSSKPLTNMAACLIVIGQLGV